MAILDSLGASGEAVAQQQDAMRQEYRQAHLSQGYRDLILRDMKTIGVPHVLWHPTAVRVPVELHPLLKRSIQERLSVGLVGCQGTGKTGFAALVVQETLRRIYKEHGDKAIYTPGFASSRVLWIDWPRRSDEFKALASANTWENPKAYARNHEIKRMERGLDLVIIDDLCREKPSPYPVDQIFLIVDELYSNYPDTQVLWTSNCPPELGKSGWMESWMPPGKSLSNIYSDAFKSRLLGMAAAVLVRCTDDQRLSH